MARKPWPRLTETLLGPKEPTRCQACGAEGSVWGNPRTLDIWQEHDEWDKPERRAVVLCRPCSNTLIKPHPRLYRYLHTNEPWPGLLALCVACRHRQGVRCAHPDAMANGGAGLRVTITRPSDAHVSGHDGRRRVGYWMKIWPEPAAACAGREVLVAQEVQASDPRTP